LYGSRKPNHDRYKVTRIYQISFDDTDNEFMRKEIPLQSFDINQNINELSVRNENHPSLFLKSSFLKERDEYDRQSNIKRVGSSSKNLSSMTVQDIPVIEDLNVANIKTQDELDMMIQVFLESSLSSQLDYDLKDSYDYVMILPPSYYESGSYLKWMKVG